VATYARLSEADRSGSDFDSIAHQVAACRAYIESRASAGWRALPDAYTDNGFSGGNANRPALARLLGDIRAGHVDLVLVHRIDRLSRNLRDLLALLGLLEEHGVAFASVNESFDSSTPIGRATLHLVGVFAQLERETIAARTRDKVRAARRRGRWCGGVTPWGYALVAGKLVPDPVEAQRVKETFALYLETGSLIDTAEEMNRRGWTTKVTPTRDGRQRGGVAWSKSSVHRVLSSPVYVARTVVDGEAFKAEHPSIVPLATWQATQERLQANGGEHTWAVRYESGALLRGLAFCSCGAALTPTFVSRPVGHAKKRFSYYACSRRIKQGKAACSQPYIPAARLESAVISEIARHAQEPAVVEAITLAAKEQLAEKRRALAAEKRAIEKALRFAAAEERAATPEPRLPALTARVAAHEARKAEIEGDLASLAEMEVDPDHVARTVANFPTLWDALLPRERRRVVEVIVERIVIRADGGTAISTVRAAGLLATQPQSLVPIS
jgi:site-specific DNA recombinase